MPFQPVLIRFLFFVWLTLLFGLGAGEAQVKRMTDSKAPLTRQALQRELNALFQTSPVSTVHWGVAVTLLPRKGAKKERALLYSLNSEKHFVPASNIKLLTTAAALQLLDTTHRFKTSIWLDGAQRDDCFFGNVIVTSDGDPTLSEKFYPQRSTIFFDAAASALQQRGIKSLHGDLIIDDRFFSVSERGFHFSGGDGDYADGWDWDDIADGTAPPASAVSYNENGLRVVITLDSLRQSTLMRTIPNSSYPILNNLTQPSLSNTEKRLAIMRRIGSNLISATGRFPNGRDTVQTFVSIEMPALYFLWELRAAFARQGILHTGSMHRHPPAGWAARASRLYELTSPPLREVISYINKESNNFTAEQLIRVLGQRRYGTGSLQSGIRAVTDVLEGFGIDKDAATLWDGSGLCRKNRVTPLAFLTVLEKMESFPQATLFRESLSIGGIDGSLKRRFTDPFLKGKVYAKTGFVTGVRSLSGYLLMPRGQRLAFSIIANNYTQPTADIEAVQDYVLWLLARWDGK